jgi:hypothetical protein
MTIIHVCKDRFTQMAHFTLTRNIIVTDCIQIDDLMMKLVRKLTVTCWGERDVGVEHHSTRSTPEKLIQPRPEGSREL